MSTVKESIDVLAPKAACYEQWLNIEQFPKFMPHVRSVTKQGTNQWHWIVDGPMGASVEWDAVVNHTSETGISWQSVPGANVENHGTVTFESITPDKTRVTATIQYEPPVGIIGEAVADMFSNPGNMIKDSLQKYKDLMESAYRLAAIK